jgi:hypothetical protein
VRGNLLILTRHRHSRGGGKLGIWIRVASHFMCRIRDDRESDESTGFEVNSKRCVKAAAAIKGVAVPAM